MMKKTAVYLAVLIILPVLAGIAAFYLAMWLVSVRGGWV